MAWRLFVDSSNGVTIEPEYDYKQMDELILNTHRARSGRNYRYKWGSFNKWKMSVRFVNSAFMAVVNSYWQSNATLLFKSESLTAVYTVAVVNKDLPIGSFEKPYLDMYKGIIELETF